MSQQGYLPGLPDFDLGHLVRCAIGMLQMHAPKDGEPYYGCFSGGKDSIVIKELARMANVPVVWHYNVTTIDPPELVRFIREKHPDVIWERPKMPFFRRMAEKGFPTRRNRWCCEEYKETKPPKGSRLILGIRGEESKRRAANWQHVTYHRRTREFAVSPILMWLAEAHLWPFIREGGIPYSALYDEGFTRLGCIGCPMARKAGRLAEFKRWPGYERQWKRAFRIIWEKRSGIKQQDGREWFGSAKFANWEEMWEWWMSDNSLLPDNECQGTLEMWA